MKYNDNIFKLLILKNDTFFPIPIIFFSAKNICHIICIGLLYRWNIVAIFNAKYVLNILH